MKDFVIKEIFNTNVVEELRKIGFDSSYCSQARNKYEFKNLKIYNLTLPQANILKQTALSFGADCAIHREVITGKVESSDVILTGRVSQLLKISNALLSQPFNLKLLAVQLKSQLSPKNRKTKIVGILNLTENSFSDGGEFYDYDKACEHLIKLKNDGADIIDIGAESTKPGAISVSAEKQLEKLLPILSFVRNNSIDIPISVDTRSSEVAHKCIDAGASIINDVSGFDFDSEMVNIVAKSGVTIVIQHSLASPETMQNNPTYESVIDEIFMSLHNKIQFAKSKGVENIVIDPGIGFGKTREHNFEIIRRVKEFYSLGYPIMIGLSRKSLLNMQDASNLEKDIYTTALNTLMIESGVDYIRVHNVEMHKKLINMLGK